MPLYFTKKAKYGIFILKEEIMMSNKVYDILKWIALVVLPALASLYVGLGQIWSGIPYPTQISGTIMLIDTFLGAILGISSINYAKTQVKSKK